MREFLENVKHLENQMQMTKNSRVNASHRLNSNGSFSEFINVYYSVFTVTLSIFAIFLKNTEFGDILSISATILSIALTISITYANSIKFKEKAQKSKDSFARIQKLQYQLSNIQNNDIETLQNIETEYSKILNEYDLHIPYDFKSYALENHIILDNKEEKKIKIECALHKAWTDLVRIVLVLFPFIFVWISYIIENYDSPISKIIF